MPPRFSFAIERPSDFFSIGVFSFTGYLFSFFHYQFRKTNKQLHGTVAELTAYKEQLEEKVKERTAELSLLVLEQNIILDNAPIGVSKIIDRKQVLVNRKTEDLFQYSKEEMKFHTTRNLYPSDAAYEKFGQEAYPVLATGLIYESEQELIRKDGTHIHVRYIGKAIEPPDMSRGTIWLLEDITEQKATKDALRESIEKYRAMVEAFHGYIYICSNDDRIEFMNEKLIQRTGHDATGELCYKALHDIDSVCEWCVNDQVFAGETVCWVTKSPKDNRWYEIINTPVFNSTGNVSKMAMITDITEKKQAEEALYQSKERFRLAVAATHAMVYDLDMASLRVQALDGLRELLGYESSEVELSLEWWAKQIHPDDLDMCRSAFKRMQTEGRDHTLEYRLRHKDGRLIVVKDRATATCNADGKLVRIVGTVVDITEGRLAMKAVRESEERQRLFIGYAPAALAMFDRNMCYLHVSHRWLQDYGLEGRNLFGQSHYDVFPEISDSWKEAHRRGLAGEVLRADADRFERADGSVQWVHREIRPWYDSEGLVGGIVIFSEDITSRIQAEEERMRLMAEVENRAALLDAAFSSMVIGLIVFDADGKIVRINETVKLLMPPELFSEVSIGERLQIMRWEKANGQLFTVEELPAARALRGETVQNEVLSTSFSGHKQWLLSCASPIRTSDGRVLGAAASFIDITESMLAETRLKRSEANLATAQEISHVGSWRVLFGEHGEQWEGSEELKRIYGYPPDMQLTMQTYENRMLPEDLEATNAAWIAAMEGAGPNEWEHRIIVDGQIKWLRVMAQFVFNSSGKLVEASGINQDITEQKRAMEALGNFNLELEKRVEERTAEIRQKDEMLLTQSRQAAMGEMIGNIAHQWRQPLNTLGLTIQQLSLFYDLGEFNKEFLDNSVNKSMELIQHMSRTIDDFRNYFRPDKRKVDFKVLEAINSTLSLIEASFKNKHIRVELVAKGDPIIHGFMNEYSQVVLNIMNNARDALTEREIKDPKVTIAIGSEGERAIVTITDNAGGIPEEIMGKIFDPYFTTKGPQTGTGVGLFMSKTIIEKNMNGSLTARNSADGAEFRIEV